MSVFIHEHSAIVTDRYGVVYRARIYGEQRPDRTWTGWIDFVPVSGTPLRPGHHYRTGQETSQPDRAALEYWASGLEPVYLDGALGRALRHHW
jgi:hypothetical protein